MEYELQNKCDIVSSSFQTLSERINKMGSTIAELSKALNKMGSTIAELSKAFRKFAILSYGHWEEDYLGQLMRYVDNCNNISNYLENRIIPLEGDR